MTTVPLIEYASENQELPAEKLLRRIVAWAAIWLGGESIIRFVLHLGLVAQWLASPPNMSWRMDNRWDLVLLVGRILTMGALLVAGLLLLRRSPLGIRVLRISLVCAITLPVVGLMMMMHNNATYASYWSTPAAATMQGLQFLDHLAMPALIAVLTFALPSRRTM